MGGGGFTPPKKNSRSFNKTLNARCAPSVFKHFKFMFMHSWMLCTPHLVPDMEYFVRFDHIIFNWEQKEINFPEIK